MRTLSIFSTLEEKVISSSVSGESINECVNNYIKTHNWGNIKVRNTHWNVIEMTFPHGNVEYMVFSDMSIKTKNFSVLDTLSNSGWETDLYGTDVKSCVEHEKGMSYSPNPIRIEHVFENVLKFTFEDGSESYQVYTPMGSRWDIV